MTMQTQEVWVLVAPSGKTWTAATEKAAWNEVTAWASEDQIAKIKARGYYARRATLTWENPE